MGSIILGFVISLIVMLILVFVLMVVYDNYNEKVTMVVAVISLFLWIASWICMSLIGIDLEKTSYKIWTQQYISQKQLIEESLDNDKLSGLERVELVKQANELNADLIYAQFKCVKWYNFTMDDKVLELEPVSLK